MMCSDTSIVVQMGPGIEYGGVSAVSKSIIQGCTTQSICSTAVQKCLAFIFKFRSCFDWVSEGEYVLPLVGNVSEVCKNERIDSL